MFRRYASLFALFLLSGCFLSPAWRQRQDEARRQRQERFEADRAYRAEVEQLRRQAELARLRYCVEHPEDCGADRQQELQMQQAAANAEAQRRQARAQAVGQALQQFSQPPQPAPQPPQTVIVQQPAPSRRPVSCTSAVVGDQTYTNCY